MNNYRLISLLRKQEWAIDPFEALAYGNFVASILNGTANIVVPENKEVSYNYDESINQGITEHKGKDVAVISIRGALFKYDAECGPVGMQTIGNWIETAANNSTVKSIVLDIDSPGGTVSGTEELANLILKAKKQKPIVAFVNGMACSAGLWIASATDKIIASTKNAKIGSVGVQLSFADMQPVWEAQGVKFHNITADQSKDKNNAYFELLKGNYELVKKESLNPLAKSFIDTIKKNRPEVEEKHLTGKVYFAKDVKGAFVDGIGDLEYAIKESQKLIKPTYKTINY